MGELSSILKEMETNEIEPNEQTVKELVHAHCAEGNLAEAHKVLAAVNSQVLPESALEEIMICYAKSGDLEKTIDLLGNFDDLTLPVIRPMISKLSADEEDNADLT
eukprot:CAMPEP_0116998716 /NCGR_PEP_ID=MMETSP0472-20121206/1695_1 /TAXON_ID=693140 ORGANISM="Tiarina fusus, Strain LIS" /NCGR_SAMPLE_ID=MMETSP0472 /ASSEMBLY_ACC=CAM_ASM_000603 /LENGTH=105 /DNA_ID=CAMNT_0004697961 /DNA_START=70 /DNA_END=383 /DNA_ORIENTATION=-